MAFFIIKLLNVYIIIILIRVILSWIRPNPYNPFVQVIYKLTEPVLAPIRRIVACAHGVAAPRRADGRPIL